ncbi:DegT/DnrJ/EryC1/StrS family aminotransferase [Pedobacter gandavensis]|uniref:Aminotransferase class I/II-fold pyridoxal phosphate-dependent enzyme n=1 Tax=Pedobacter gandavensis TaxID=2679963 RepID=A0ABR6EU13_9SPHI|nr:DegT/DnrJ/EryC1/StrS family aminotransferase [Pedobacter gandavensis]MBB2148456.1 aminotransferase class I/II-fold pyridoxal phosphate-dependent enzyme [Pedobacter gandavensis]
MNIPFSPPFIDQNVINEVMDTLKSGWITSGPKVIALEKEVVRLTRSKAAICVNSWTSAAIMMLKWFGVQEGDEVIIPAYSYCATALCVLHCGATPVMVDIADDLTIDPQRVKMAITSRTKAIIAVDIAGLPCDYNTIKTLIRSAKVRALFVPNSDEQRKLGRILLISDAAHSIGATYMGHSSALSSDITIFSFHAVKNVTTAEGGCACLNLPGNFNHEEEYKFLKIFALNGQNKDAYAKSKGANWKYDILYKGLKINMPDICASIGLAQIKQYKRSLMPERKKIAEKYCNILSNYEWFIPPTLKDFSRESSYHIFPMRIKHITEAQRDHIIEDIVAFGVIVNVHFIPMPMLSYFKKTGYNIVNYPNSYTQYACEISLPIYPTLSDADTDYIIDAVIKAVQAQMLHSKRKELAMVKTSYLPG